MEHIRFLKAAVRDRNVGAICPTGTTGVRSICRRIDRTRPVVVVEYGPGTGVFTRGLLRCVHPDSTILAIELNRVFAGRLRRYGKLRKSKAPNLVVAKSDARNVVDLLQRHGHEKADFILSGIPFSFFDEATRDQILARTYEALAPGGRFLVYQYSFQLGEMLEGTFDTVERQRVFRNIPPLCIMDAHKRTDAKVASDSADEQFGRQTLKSSVPVHASQR